MKTIRLLSILFVAALILPSCNDEIKLTADWKDIPVVYGLLDKDDQTHYIRIEKVFVDPDKNAEDLALIPDSIYYENLTVEIQKLSTGERVTLNRVNGDDIGIPRDSGAFVSSPNYLYTFDAADMPFSGGEDIRLLLNRGDDQPLITADASIVGAIVPTGIGAGTIDFKYERDRDFRWQSGDEARVFDLKLVIHFLENDLEDPDPAVERELVWQFANAVPRNDNGSSGITTYSQSGTDFFTFLQSQLVAKPSINRTWIGMDFVIIGGGEALGQYIAITEANTGITSAQELPTYSNVIDGLGIFSSISTGIAPNLTLSGSALDSLQNGIYTKDLNF
ncbi:MAG: hypothetical protein KDC34_17390 [Saprospiraceae bacterium]|nr:hypothetical protein [Saprospiraceae bacterium]